MARSGGVLADRQRNCIMNLKSCYESHCRNVSERILESAETASRREMRNLRCQLEKHGYVMDSSLAFDNSLSMFFSRSSCPASLKRPLGRSPRSPSVPSAGYVGDGMQPPSRVLLYGPWFGSMPGVASHRMTQCLVRERFVHIGIASTS